MIKKEVKKAEKTDEKHEEISIKEQEVNQNKILRNLLLIVGLIAIFVAGYLLFSYASSNFTYKGVKFSIVNDEWVKNLYNTKVPVTYQGAKTDYNFYLRMDPRETVKEVPFNGSLYIRPNMVINTTNDIQCHGDGIIALANLINLYKVLGTKVIQDANATCDNQSRYVYIKIQISNRTSVEETAPACYNINVNNCEVLKATERYMIETFVELQKYITK